MCQGNSSHAETLLATLHPLVRKWARKWKTPGIVDVEIGFSSRMRTSLGRAYLRKKIVRLNEILLLPENRELFVEVACHEIAHLAAYELSHGSCRPHGAEWARLVSAAGFSPRLRAKAVGPEPVRRSKSSAKVVYLHRCRTCHAMRTAPRPMTHWRCSACAAAGLPGEISITSRPAKRSSL